MCMYNKMYKGGAQSDDKHAFPICVKADRICLEKKKYYGKFVMFMALLEIAVQRYSSFQTPNTFAVIVGYGCIGDLVEVHFDKDLHLKYFELNNITHFGKHTCDYEARYIHNDDEAVFARGKIEVSIDFPHNIISVTGDADCDGTSYNEAKVSSF
ncbi:hypothetical protein KCU83_g7390, partial [Aureobasidium melanogenum]